MSKVLKNATGRYVDSEEHENEDKRLKNAQKQGGRIFRSGAGFSGGPDFPVVRPDYPGAEVGRKFGGKPRQRRLNFADRIKEGYNQQLKLEKDVI